MANPIQLSRIREALTAEQFERLQTRYNLNNNESLEETEWTALENSEADRDIFQAISAHLAKRAIGDNPAKAHQDDRFQESATGVALQAETPSQPGEVTIPLESDPDLEPQRLEILEELKQKGVTNVQVFVTKRASDTIQVLIVPDEGATGDFLAPIRGALEPKGFRIFSFPETVFVAQGPLSDQEKEKLFRVGGGANAEFDFTSRSQGYQHVFRFGGNIGFQFGPATLMARYKYDAIGRDDPILVMETPLGRIAGPFNAEQKAWIRQDHELWLFFEVLHKGDHSLHVGAGARREVAVALLAEGGERWGRKDQGLPTEGELSPTVGYSDGVSPRVLYEGPGLTVDITGWMFPIGNNRTRPYSEWRISADKEVGRFHFGTKLKISGRGKRPGSGLVYATYDLVPDLVTVGAFGGTEEVPDWRLGNRAHVGVLLRIRTPDKFDLLNLLH